MRCFHVVSDGVLFPGSHLVVCDGVSYPTPNARTSACKLLTQRTRAFVSVRVMHSEPGSPRSRFQQHAGTVPTVPDSSHKQRPNFPIGDVVGCVKDTEPTYLPGEPTAVSLLAPAAAREPCPWRLGR